MVGLPTPLADWFLGRPASTRQNPDVVNLEFVAAGVLCSLGFSFAVWATVTETAATWRRCAVYGATGYDTATFQAPTPTTGGAVMTHEQDAANVDRLINEAISVLYPRDMVGRYLLVAEVIDAEDGERAGVCLTSDNAMPWDTLGLAEFALARERANVARFEAEGD